MKQYVLDDTPVPVDTPPEAAGPPRWRGLWRALLVLAVVEPVVLALLYVALVGVPSFADDKVETRSAPVALAQPVVAPPPAPAQVQRVEPAAAEPETVAEASSRITRERGRIVIELHGAEVGAALAMLTKATHATVSGSDLLLGRPQRIDRTLVAASPAEAWQAVFGDLGSFAIACTAQSCNVHFVAVARVGGEATATGQPEGGGFPSLGAPAEAVAIVPAPVPARKTAQTEDPTSSEN